MMEKYDEYFSVNKALWDKKTAIHKNSDFYDLASFKAGKNTLHPTELKEVGDVRDKSILHLLCHFGLDSLSWARLGAKVTGVDFSPEAIGLANSLSRESGIPATFICANLYDLPQHLDREYDIVFLSYGALCWLPDLDKLAEIAARFLRPGGIFYVIDFHPALWMFDEEVREITYSYFGTGEPIREESVGTYAEQESTFTHLEYYWTHDLGELINGLIRHGFRIQHLNEFPYMSNPAFKGSVRGEDGHYRIPRFQDKLPLMFSVRAQKETPG